MKWKASVFGPFRLDGPDGRPFHTKSKRLQAMLAFLASLPSQCTNRSFLAEALFDLDDVPGRPNMALLLTRGLASLAEHSGVTLLVVNGQDVSLRSSHLESDFSKFESSVRRARSEKDPLAAGILWRKALEIADRRPLSDVDHSLLVPARERIGDTVLEALTGLACGPLGVQSAGLILDRLKEFELERFGDALRTEQLMRIYAALGKKEEILRAFSAYETHLDYECGERAPVALAALLDSLLAAMDQPKAPGWGVPPNQPTFGRTEELRALTLALGEAGPDERLTTLTGQCGIGKSHLLRALYWQLVPGIPTLYFDLETQPIEIVGKLLNDRPSQVVLIDHVEASHRLQISRLLSDHPETRFGCASHSRLDLAGESLMTLGALEWGRGSQPGPAIELLERNLRLVHDAARRQAVQGDPDPQLFELASLCDGIPLALEIAGRLSGSIGLKATIGSLRRNVDALTSSRRDSSRRTSLRNAIATSCGNLSAEAQRLVAFLARLGAPCHVDHLLACANAMPCDLEEGILSGLVVRDAGSPYVRVLRSTAAALDESSESEALALQMAEFRDRSTQWFVARAAEPRLDLGIADSLPLALTMVDQWIEAGRFVEAIALFASLRPWIGSCPLAPSQLAGIERVLMGDTAKDPNWQEGALTLSAAHFHAGAFAKMKEVVSSARRRVDRSSISADTWCQLTMQLALAERALGNLDAAVAGYQEALDSKDPSLRDSTRVKCYYNLGTLLETQGRLSEALEAQEAASDHFSTDTDPRVESLVNTCIGRLRYRLGDDLDSAGLILEATLAHARERQDLRAVGEILQNLGQIYWERREFARAALAEARGTHVLLDFGYSEEFRRLAKSSLVTLCGALFEIGLDDLAHATRTLIDRLGAAELYAPNQILFDRLAEKTYAHPPDLRLAVASETEVRQHLQHCLERLQETDTRTEQAQGARAIGIPNH